VVDDAAAPAPSSGSAARTPVARRAPTPVRRLLGSRNNLALVLQDLGRLEEAEAEHRAVLEARVRLLGAEHPHTLTSRNNLAVVLRALGKSP
jgi:hypothetical protein